MDKYQIESTIRGFLERVAENGFRLSDTIPERERQAILQFIKSDSSTDADKSDKIQREPAADLPALNLSSLKPHPSADSIVGLDFGTAFSKATVSTLNAEHPMPLELQVAATGKRGLLLESTLYVSAIDDKVFFGPQAVDVSSTEDILGRQRFDSPKQVLSIEGVEGLPGKLDVAIDPTQSFTKRDLLTLYLGYLSAMLSEQLEKGGHSRYCTRRYAIPVWSSVQVGEISRALKQMLIDAQILADTIPIDAWRSGLNTSYAKALLQKLKQEVPANDPRRAEASLIGEHALEASAAAVAIGEKLTNRRPVALVVDIGAGTTDIGLFYFVFPDGNSDRRPKIAPFVNGSLAKKIAGNRLDELLRDYIRNKGGLSDGDPVFFRVKRDIRDIKRQLVLTGKHRIEGLDDLELTLSDFIQSSQVKQYRGELRNAVGTLVSQLGASRLKTPDGYFGVLTGGGANFPIFEDFFSEPFETTDGPISFRSIDARPEWLSGLDPVYVQFFGQLAVALGASAPNLPNQTTAITAVPSSVPPMAGLAPTYRN